MGEVFEPLDPVDAQAVAEGCAVLDDVKDVDSSEPEVGIDCERVVVLEDRRGHEVDDPNVGATFFTEPDEGNETEPMGN